MAGRAPTTTCFMNALVPVASSMVVNQLIACLLGPATSCTVTDAGAG
jgi:hypothetical protein